jgi:hypothetical protein
MLQLKKTLVREVKKDMLLKFYKVLAIPMLLYRAECWSLNRQEMRRIEATERRFMRAVAGRDESFANESFKVSDSLMRVANNSLFLVSGSFEARMKCRLVYVHARVTNEYK